MNVAASGLLARQRTPQQKRSVLLASLVVLGVIGGGFYAIEGVPSSNTPLSFHLDERSPDDTGIHFVHEKPGFAPFFDNVYPFMAAVSAAACVSDVDRDGDLDLLMLTSGPNKQNHLYKNDTKKGGPFKFSRWSMPSIENLNVDGFSSDCTFADVDNDGFEDLLVGTACQAPRLFLNQNSTSGRTFVDVTAKAGLPDYMNGFSASFFDANRDGNLDVVLADYFRGRYDAKDVPGAPHVHNYRVPDAKGAGQMMPNDWGAATNGGVKSFLLGDGTGKFIAQDLAEWGFTETRFTFDIGTADINLDGYTDLYFANDFGPDQLYLSKGGKTFVDVKGDYPTDVGRDSFKGMNADLADIDHDGYPEIYVTNVFHPVLPEGNLLWQNKPHESDPFLRRFENIAASVGVKDGGWGWGAKFVDIDLDGDVDLMATNGYISQNPDVDYWYRASRLVAGDKRLIEDSRQWPEFNDASMSGHQVSHVFVKEEHRYFNRAADAGVKRSFDGRGVVIADFDVDGRPDVLFVPQGQPYFLGHNRFVPTDDVKEAPHFVGLQLFGDGIKVNRSAIGARVKVTPKTGNAFKPTFKEISAGNGMTSQSMSWIHVGTGSYTGDVEVEVFWPDGTTSKHVVDTDAYHVVVAHGARAPAAEPPAVEAPPADDATDAPVDEEAAHE